MKLTKQNYDKAKYSPHKWQLRGGTKNLYHVCEKCGMEIIDNRPLPVFFCGYDG